MQKPEVYQIKLSLADSNNEEKVTETTNTEKKMDSNDKTDEK